MPHRTNGHAMSLRSKAHALSEGIGALKDTVEEAVERKFAMLKAASGRAAKAGRRQLSSMHSKTSDHVSRNPLRSVLIATGAGVLLGFLVGRR